MAIIVKFLYKNILEKKFRTFLILFSIMLSSALYFASNAISGSFEQMYLERLKKYYGSADIVIHAGEKSPSRFLSVAPAQPFLGRAEYIVGAIEGSEIFKPQRNEVVNLDLKGFTLEELRKLSPLSLKEDSQLAPFQGNKLIIGRNLAEKYHLTIGSGMTIMIWGAKHRFRISGIAELTGIFSDDGRSNTVVLPRETLASLYYAPGRVSVIYLKLRDPALIQKTIHELADVYPRYMVREPVSKAEIRQNLSSTTTSFMLMLTLVLVISIFIIYTAFKVIVRERLPIIGTFRSLGATKLRMNLVLLGESLFYGILGGLGGCALGTGILYVMMKMMTATYMSGVPLQIIFTPAQLAAAFLLAVVLALISSLVPILQIVKTPIKDIILNKIESKQRKTPWKIPLGILLLVITGIVPYHTPQQYALMLDLACMITAILAVVMLVPYLTAGFIKVFEKIYLYTLGNEGILAAKNLRDNKSILNNISLLAIGISSLLMINTITYSVERLVINVYQDFKFDIWMNLYQADRNQLRVLQTIPGVAGVYGMYSLYNVELADRPERITWVNGVTQAKFADYIDVNLEGDSGALLAKLEEDRNILISFTLKEKWNVDRGDYVSLKTKRGKKNYRIIGFFRSLLDNGSYALIGERYLKQDMGLRYFSEIFLKTTGDLSQVVGEVKKRFERRQPWLTTMKDMEARNITSNRNMFFILQGFSLLAMLIGIVGVLNNLLISFIERQRHLAMLRSVGMSRFQLVKMILAESLTGGIIGGTVGVLAGLLLINISPQLAKAINLPLRIVYSNMLIVNSLLGGILIMIMATISPAIKSAKLSIIEAIKYE